MATLKSAIGGVFGVITDTTAMVGGVAQSGSAGVAMLNKYIADAGVKQKVSSAADMHLFRNRLKRSVAQEEAESVEAVTEYCSRSEEHLSAYKSAYDEISSIIDNA